MPLNEELKTVDPEFATAVADAFFDRILSDLEVDEFRTDDLDDDYPFLNSVMNVFVERLQRLVPTDEAGELMVAGAGLILGTIVEVAKVQALQRSQPDIPTPPEE